LIAKVTVALLLFSSTFQRVAWAAVKGIGILFGLRSGGKWLPGMHDIGRGGFGYGGFAGIAGGSAKAAARTGFIQNPYGSGYVPGFDAAAKYSKAGVNFGTVLT